jgi:FkbM family methyltransferase
MAETEMHSKSLTVWLVRQWIEFYVLIKKRSGIQLKGLGFVLRLIKRDFVFEVSGCTFFFEPRCAAAYAIMPAGYWNEPETHLFFRKVIPSAEQKVSFVDVGASIGEMGIDVAGLQQVVRAYCFEPQEDCAASIRRSAALNHLGNIEVRQCALSDTVQQIRFECSARSPSSARLVVAGDSAGPMITTSTLDNELGSLEGQVLMLIDVEGAEVQVLRGGEGLVNRTRPLIVFEYNKVSKRQFGLEDVAQLLGKSYELFRLRHDGLLDRDFTSTWNCVAVPLATNWESSCRKLIVA